MYIFIDMEGGRDTRREKGKESDRKNSEKDK